MPEKDSIESLINDPELQKEIQKILLGDLIHEMNVLYMAAPHTVTQKPLDVVSNISAYIRYEAIRRELNRRERERYYIEDDGR